MMQVMRSPLNGWRVFWYFFAFFAFITAVNAVFITIALESFTGVTTEHTYEKGLKFNQTLEEARDEKYINERMEARYNGGRIEVLLKDTQGEPLDHANVSVRLVRPVQAGYDFDVILPAVGRGLYAADVDFSLPGQWEARISATWNQRTIHHLLPLTVTSTSSGTTTE